jgi:GntR family transcriptional repressor for pyruvate dehydrogenase complex
LPAADEGVSLTRDRQGPTQVSDLFPVFRPIVGSRAFEEVIGQISYAIRSGRYRPGERLPTVEVLANAMGVSRPTVGEAVRVLADHGVVEARRGATGGVIVTSSMVPAEVLRMFTPQRSDSLRELAEARLTLERELTRLAARRATSEHIAELWRSVAQLEPARRDPVAWLEVNNLFHYTLARAAGNRPLARFHHEVMEELAILLEGFDERYTDYERTVRVHTATVEALEKGDLDRLDQLTDEHMAELFEVAEWFDKDEPAEQA